MEGLGGATFDSGLSAAAEPDGKPPASVEAARTEVARTKSRRVTGSVWEGLFTGSRSPKHDYKLPWQGGNVLLELHRSGLSFSPRVQRNRKDIAICKAKREDAFARYRLANSSCGVIA